MNDWNIIPTQFIYLSGLNIGSVWFRALWTVVDGMMLVSYFTWIPVNDLVVWIDSMKLYIFIYF